MELYAIRYGTAPFALKYLFRDQADSKDSVHTDWLIYLAIVNGRVLQFDTGFRSATDAKDWNLTFTDWEREREELLAGKRLDTIIITHAHFDHIQNIDQYPDAKIVIANGAMDSPIAYASEAVKKRLSSGNVYIVEDEAVLENIFRLKVINGHDKGSCVAYFSAGEKNYVLTGDECYTSTNALENRPIGSIFCDAERNIRFTADTYKQGLIPLPCHDNIIFETYPKISNNIVRIV